MLSLPSARAFCRLERHIRIAQQQVRRITVVGKDADADAGGDGERVALEQKGLAQVLEQSTANTSRVRNVWKITQPEDELIAALARQGVDLPNRTDSSRSLICLKKASPSFISQVVVDLFEAIQVNATNSKQLALPLSDDHRLPQPIFQ